MDGLPQPVARRWCATRCASLGPKVLASRMVRDYVERLYTPGGAWPGAPSTAPATSRPRTSPPGRTGCARRGRRFAVDHVESSGVGESPELGQTLALRVTVSLGELVPEDVAVELLHGSVDPSDRLVSPTRVAMPVAKAQADGTYRYDGVVPLERTGSFGYTVRVLPSNPLLANSAEMNLVAVACGGRCGCGRARAPLAGTGTDG